MSKKITSVRPTYKTSEKVKALKKTTPVETTDSSFDTLVASVMSLDKLSKQKLLDLLLLDRQSTSTSRTDRKYLMWIESLNFSLSAVLGQRQRVFPTNLTSVARKKLEEVEDFLHVVKLDKEKTDDTKWCYNLIASLFVKQAVETAKRLKIPLSMKIVLQSNTPVVALVDDNFPGYVRSGLFKKVLLVGRNGVQHEGDYDD